MAIVHGDIGGAEPSTVTFKVDTVTLSQNSTTVHREVLVIGDGQSSVGYASVTASTPGSTEFGLSVRHVGNVIIQGNSTAVIQGNSTVVFLPAYLSTAAAPANSTALNVRVVGGPSSAADFPVSISGNSTVVQGTNPWTIAGNSTAVQGTNPWLCAITSPLSSAAPAAGDSGVIVRQVGYSTIISIAALPANSSQVEVRNTVTIQGNSTVVVSAFAAGLISSAAAAGNSSALLVRIVGGASSAADFIANVSSLAGIVAVRPSDTNWASSAGFHFDSSGSLLTTASISGSTNVTVSGIFDSSNATVKPGDSANSALRVNIIASAVGSAVDTDDNTVAGGQSSVALVIAQNYGFDGSTSWIRVGASTAAPSSGTAGLLVRPIIDNIITTASSNAFGTSTTLSLQSSAAGIRNYVTAYSITSTVATATKLAFYSGSSMNWPIVLQAVSSAIAGANLAVSAPAYLFRTNAAETFTLNMGGSSIAGFKVAVSFFRAP